MEAYDGIRPVTVCLSNSTLTELRKIKIDHIRSSLLFKCHCPDVEHVSLQNMGQPSLATNTPMWEWHQLKIIPAEESWRR